MKALILQTSCPGIELRLAEITTTPPALGVNVWNRNCEDYAGRQIAFSHCNPKDAYFDPAGAQAMDFWVGATCFRVSRADAIKISEVFSITAGLEHSEAA